MMMLTLSELLTLKKQLLELTKDEPHGDPKTISGRMAARREAEEQLSQVVADLTARVQIQLAVVYVVGTDDEKVKTAKLVAAEMGAVVVSGNQLYDQLGLGVQGFAALNKAFVAGCYGGVESGLYELMNLYRLQGGVVMTHDYLDAPVVDFNDLRRIIRTIVDKQDFSQNLRALVAATKVIQETQRLEIVDEPLPVVLYGFESVEDVNQFSKYFYPDRPGVVANIDTAKSVDVELKSAAVQLSKLLGV